MRSRRLTGKVGNQSKAYVLVTSWGKLKNRFFEIAFLQLLHNLSLSISHRLTWYEIINLILLFYFSLIFHSWDSMHSFCRFANFSSLWQYKRCTLTRLEFRPLISNLFIEENCNICYFLSGHVIQK